MNINPLNDTENLKQQRNLTNSQRKKNLSTKEGVLVNNFVKDNGAGAELNLSDTKDTYVISDNVPLPAALYKDRKIVDKKLVPLSGITLGVMGGLAVITEFVKRSAKITQNLAKEKCLPPLTRNVNLNKEFTQIMYQMVQSPNKKTFLAGVGTLTLGAMAFMGQTFFNGYKEVWVKRKEADIQKNLQEKLIAVETQAFSGKMQIIRSMLSRYTGNFEKYLQPETDEPLLNFGRNKFSPIPFTAGAAAIFGSKKTGNQKKQSDFGNILLGIGTFAGITGFGFLSLKNLSKSKKFLEEGVNIAKNTIKEIVKSSNENTKQTDKNNLEILFRSIEGTKGVQEFITEQSKLLKWTNEKEKTEFADKILTQMRTSTTKANPNYAGDGIPKPAFNSFVNEYLAFFYNWLLDTSNPQFRHLFLGITGITAACFGGKLAGDAIREVQVKRINAETELELQKRLVSTELRNFKSKKDAAIQPLVEEFYKQAGSGSRTKEELKTMAENVLFEIKNGAPFVYS